LYKHLATLSTGSILLLVTFLEKVFSQPEWKSLVVFAFIGFSLSIAGTLLMQVASLFHITTTEPESIPTKFGILAILLGFGGFSLGLLSLVAFAIKNLFCNGPA